MKTLRFVASLLVLGACSDKGTSISADMSGRADASQVVDAAVATDSDLPHTDAANGRDMTTDASADFSSTDAATGPIVEATSCEQQAVEAALAQAPPGATVQVPAGNCTWTQLIVDQPVHLRGASPDATVITVADVTIRKQASGVTRLSEFGFEKAGGGNQSKGFVVEGSWKNAEPVVFQDNRFAIDNTGLFALRTVGGVIIARNAFIGGWDDSFIQPKHSGDPDGSWTSADTMGTRDPNGTLNHYIEGNTFEGGTNQGIDADDATRVVYRYNTLTYSSFNTHGYATSSDGVRHFEVYENTFVHNGGESMLANQNWLIWLRGGTGVIHNNAFTEIAGSYWGDKAEIRMTIRGAEDARPQGDCGSVAYPVPRQLGQSHDGQAATTDPIYLWDNTGAQVISADWNWGNPCNLVFDEFFALGRDAINGTAKPNYAPFAYPHPLVLP